MSVTITIHGRMYKLYRANENPKLSKYAHMVDCSTGQIPEREQRPLLREFLLQCGIDIEPWEEKDTHWCVRQAIRYMEGKPIRKREYKTSIDDDHITPPKVRHRSQPIRIDAESIERIHAIVEESSNYGAESEVIRNFFRKFPKHDDLEMVAAKIAMIDLAYSTRLSAHKSDISLMELAQIIMAIPNIDDRIAQGDPRVVEEIAHCNGTITLFSFASKYCTCHNVEVYGRDDYSIFDGVVADALPAYGNGLTKSLMQNWRKNCDYVSFNHCINEILDENDIHVPFRRRKFDHYLWFINRKNTKE